MEITNKALYCEKCSLQFDKKIVYDIHLSFVHKMNIEIKSEEKELEIRENDAGLVLQCNITKSKQNIANSIKKVNNSHSQKGNVKIHIDSVHAGNKPHKCTICDYFFSQKRYLKQHIESVHEGKKPFKCDICNYSCSKKDSMKRHVASVHEGEKPFNCDICYYTCSSKSNMNKHVVSLVNG